MSTPTVSNVGKTGYSQIQTSTMSPEKSQLYKQVLGGVGPGLTSGINQLSELAAGGNQEMWNQLEAPALRQFGQLQGQLASRFSGMGTGARRSSGFQNASTGAATDLAERLQGQRLGLQNNAMQQLMSLYGGLMGTPEFENNFLQNQKPWWHELIAGLGGVAGQAAGSFGGLGLGKVAGLTK